MCISMLSDYASDSTAEAREKEALLQDELNKSRELATRVHQLEMDLQEAAEKYREQVLIFGSFCGH